MRRRPRAPPSRSRSCRRARWSRSTASRGSGDGRLMLHRHDRPTRECGGFYEPELTIVGGGLAGLGAAATAIGARTHATWVVVAGVALVGIGVVLVTIDAMQHHRFRREERERRERADRPPD